MLDVTGGTWRELDLGVRGSASGNGMVVLQRDESPSAFVVFVGYASNHDDPQRREVVALVTILGLVQSVFGYPNEEAYWHDPRGSLSTVGIFELLDSSWGKNIRDYNDRTFYAANTHMLQWRSEEFAEARHFFIGSKDNSVQFLANDIRAEIFALSKFGAVANSALAKLFDEDALWGDYPDLRQ
jgi:hypothetical protein